MKELEQMLQETNHTQVAPEEHLSDHVYEYDAKEYELFRSDRAADCRELAVRLYPEKYMWNIRNMRIKWKVKFQFVE